MRLAKHNLRNNVLKAIIFLNGQPYDGAIDVSDAVVIAADGGYQDCVRRGITPHRVVGDFDSLGYVPCGATQVPVQKDFTDGEMAVNLALKLGATEIDIYGGGGKREDHFYGNLQLLYAAHKMGVFARMITNESTIFTCDKGFSLSLPVGTTLSVAPFSGDLHIHSSTGFAYAADGLTIPLGSTRGISNLTQEKDVAMTFLQGVAVVFVCHKI